MRLCLGMVLALLAAPLPQPAGHGFPGSVLPWSLPAFRPALAQRPAQPPARPPARPDAVTEAVIANELGLALSELYVVPAGSTEQGEDRLGASDTLPSGASLRVPLGRARLCLHDVRGVLADGSVEERRGVDLCRNPRLTLGDPSAPLREADVVNDTDLALREFYAMPAGAGARGPDRLGAEIVAPEATFRLRLGRARQCLYDLTAVFEDDSVEEKRRVDLCRRSRVSFGDAAIPWRQAEVENASGRAMRNLYAVGRGTAPEGAPEGAREGGGPRWGPDRLGATLLDSGESLRLRLRSRSCLADLRAVYEDDAAEEKSGVDLCDGGAIRFDGGGIPRAPERAITLVNRHGAAVQEIYASPVNDSDWGEDRLEGRPMERGARTELVLRSACEADLRIVFANGGAEERRGLDICENSLIVLRPGWTLAERLGQGAGPVEQGPPREGSVRFRNTGGVPLVELYADAPGAPRGPDRLGATVLGRGETLDFAPPGGLGCTVHLRGVFRDGRLLDRPDFDLCAGTEVNLP